MNQEYAESDLDKSIKFKNYFSVQTTMNDWNKQLPYLQSALYWLEKIVIPVEDMIDVLLNQKEAN